MQFAHHEPWSGAQVPCRILSIPGAVVVVSGVGVDVVADGGTMYVEVLKSANAKNPIMNKIMLTALSKQLFTTSLGGVHEDPGIKDISLAGARR